MFNTGPAYGEAVGQYQGDPLYHASLDAAEYEALLGRVGFDVVAHVIEDEETGGAHRLAYPAKGGPGRVGIDFLPQGSVMQSTIALRAFVLAVPNFDGTAQYSLDVLDLQIR
jgi:hypothetical protein